MIIKIQKAAISIYLEFKLHRYILSELKKEKKEKVF